MTPNTDALKRRVRDGLVEYGLNVVYLTIVFGAFTVYRRLLLADHGIVYGNYWVAVIEALVLGKVIMIASIFHLGQWLEDRPLVYPVLYKTVVFCLIVAAFKWLEEGMVDWWNGEGIGAGLAAFAAKGWHEVLANSLIVFVAFVPFFAVKELGRVLGGSTIAKLFFRRRDAA